LALASLPGAKVLSFDQDPEALANGAELLKKNNLNNVTLVDSNFENFEEHATEFLSQNKRDGFNGVVMDLGVSSHHFDQGDRGFSFRQDAKLDMRMNPRAGESASDLIANAREEDLADIFWLYGEEKLSRRIAKEIIHQRKSAPI